jgi:hypothetical protein
MVTVGIMVGIQIVSAFQYVVSPDRQPRELRTTQIGIEKRLDEIQSDLDRIDEPRRKRLMRIESALGRLEEKLDHCESILVKLDGVDTATDHRND